MPPALTLLLLVAPSTMPAVRPRTDELLVTDARHAFTFVIPRNWKPVDEPAGERSLYVYQLPATGEARRATPSWILTAEPLEDPNSDLAGLCAHVRERIQTRNADAKIETDEATPLAGHDGWTFAYATTLTVTVIEQPGDRRHTEQVKVRVRDQLFIANGLVFEFVLTSDERGLPVRTRLVDRVIGSVRLDEVND